MTDNIVSSYKYWISQQVQGQDQCLLVINWSGDAGFVEFHYAFTNLTCVPSVSTPEKSWTQEWMTTVIIICCCLFFVVLTGFILACLECDQKRKRSAEREQKVQEERNKDSAAIAKLSTSAAGFLYP